MNPKPWQGQVPDYEADHLAVWAKNVGFMRDPKFQSAYRRGHESGHKIAAHFGLEELGIEWRAHFACWAAMHAKHLPGDFVECGVNTGVLSLAVCEYIDFNATGKRFWLFDTYQGIPEDQISERERPLRTAENGMYPDRYELAKANFAPFPGARLVRGKVPDTLRGVDISPVCYLSLDMNIAAPELAAIQYFWPRLAHGAPVVLDDYAWKGYDDQKTAMDEFAASVGVDVLTLKP